MICEDYLVWFKTPPSPKPTNTHQDSVQVSQPDSVPFYLDEKRLTELGFDALAIRLQTSIPVTALISDTEAGDLNIADFARHVADVLAIITGLRLADNAQGALAFTGLYWRDLTSPVVALLSLELAGCTR